MKNSKNNIGTMILFTALILSILAVISVLLFGIVHSKNKAAEKEAERTLFKTGYDDDEIYHLNEKTLVDFETPIIEQFNKESKLVVSSVTASIDLNLKQTGLIDVGILNKSQKIKYRGVGRFYVDLLEESNINITVNDEDKTVTLKVPHAKLYPIEIDPDGFESEDAKKGLLAFGDLKFTPVEYNDLQTECKDKLEKSINTKENRIKADENALSEIERIYGQIVKSLDDSYELKVEFFDKLGTAE